MILLQDNDPYNLTVVNVRPGEKQTMSVVAGGRYCIMELSIGNEFDSEVKYSRDFTAEEFTRSITEDIIIPASIILIVIVIGKLYLITWTSYVCREEKL